MIHHRHWVLFSIASLFGLSATLASAADELPIRLKVSAGKVDRRQSIIEFAAPPAIKEAGNWEAISSDGNQAAVQSLGDGRAVLRLAELKAGESREFALTPMPLTVGAAVAKEAGVRRLSVGGKDVLVYRGETVPPPAGYEPAFARGGYLHPLLTPAGVTVTDDYPPNHKHHHGVWSPWTKTSFEGRAPDFWNMGLKTGKVEFAGYGATWEGVIAAGFTAKHRFVDLTAKSEPKIVLNETWRVSAYAIPVSKDQPARHHVFGWESTQTCATESSLLLPKYHYGGLGVRGHRQWDGEKNSKFLTSEGRSRLNGNDTAARWTANYGMVDGKPAYVAVLGAPSNFRAPQTVRLHPKEPFMCFVPQATGDFSIEPGKPYVMKYRFVVGDGEPDQAELDRLWEDFANSASVEVVR